MDSCNRKKYPRNKGYINEYIYIHLYIASYYVGRVKKELDNNTDNFFLRKRKKFKFSKYIFICETFDQ